MPEPELSTVTVPERPSKTATDPACQGPFSSPALSDQFVPPELVHVP